MTRCPAIWSASLRPHGSSTLTTAALADAGSNSRALAAKYSSMVWWWSRWSRLRLVNAATSKTMPSTRCWASPCEDTSMATARIPSARRPASWAWSTGASGVVRAPSSVPITPLGTPAWARTERTSWVTVVFPLVPVTPTMVMARAGWSWKAEATAAMAGLTSPGVTRTWVTSSSRNRSQRSEAAPPMTAWAAWRWPSVCSPGTQQNSEPGPTRRLSKSTAVTSVDAGSPRTSSTSMSWISLVISTGGSSRRSEGRDGSGDSGQGPPRALPWSLQLAPRCYPCHRRRNSTPRWSLPRWWGSRSGAGRRP